MHIEEDSRLVPYYDEDHLHHLEKRLAFPGADSQKLFNALFGTDAILTFAAVSFTITAFRTISHLLAGKDSFALSDETM